MRIRSKLGLGFAVVLALFSATGVVAFQRIRRMYREEVGAQAQASAVALLGAIERTIHNRLEALEVFARSDPAVLAALRDSNQAFVARSPSARVAWLEARDEAWRRGEGVGALLERGASRRLRAWAGAYRATQGHDVFPEVFVTDAYGGLIAATNRTSDFRQDDEGWWQRGREDGLWSGPVVYDESAQAYCLELVVRVEDEGGPLGVVKAVLDIRDVFAVIDRFQEELPHPGAYVEWVELSGRGLYRPDAPALFGSDLSSAPAVAALRTQETGFRLGERDGTEVLQVFAAHRGDGAAARWGAVLTVPTRQVFAGLEAVERGVLVACGAVALAAALISMWVALRVTRPIQALLEATRRIARGDLQQAVAIPSPDEIGEFARAFEDMRTSLRHRTEDLEREVEVRAQTERELREATEAAEAANQAKSEFLASMSHELRTPLNAMIGYTALVNAALRDTIPARHARNLGNAEKSARTLLHLINQVLDVSKIEAGKMELYLEPVSLPALFDEVLVHAEGLALDRPVTLERAFPLTLPDAETDYTKLKQILTNLLGNAVKFTESGTVTLRAMHQRAQQALTIEIEDSGCGIPPEQRHAIFESFRQVDSSIQKRFGGTGLGLAIVKRLCDMLGIELGFESAVGQGTTFFLTVPLAHRGPLDTDPAPLPQPTPPSPPNKPPHTLATAIDADFKGAVAVVGPTTTATSVGAILAGLPVTVERVPDADALGPLSETRFLLAVLWDEASGPLPSPDLADAPVIPCCTDPPPSSLTHGVWIRKPITPQRLIDALLGACPQRGEVLVVEDDPTNRDLYTELLSADGFQVVTAANGHQALARLAQPPPPAAILLDLLLPELDGFAVLERLTSDLRAIPVVVVTGADLTPAEEAALEGGTRALLRKGCYTPADLLRYLDRVLGDHPPHPERILVVDDNTTNLELMSELLQTAGFDVVAASSGARALELATQRPLAGVLMDLAMPDMDGFEATQRLHALPNLRDVPVIACSAFTTVEFRERAAAVGCAGYLTKPVEPEHLAEQLQRYLLASRIRTRLRALR